MYERRIDNDLEDLPTSDHVHVVNTDGPEEQEIAALLNVHHFNSLTSLKRVTTRVLQFVHNMKHPKSKISDGVISAREPLHVSKVWIKSIQSSYYAREIKDLQSQQANPLARQLRLFLDFGWHP